jgi:hypothetical protein
VKEEFRANAMSTKLMPGFSDIPTLSHLSTSTLISQSPHPLVAISTNPQQSSPQQAL